jgi:hypothetical protein
MESHGLDGDVHRGATIEEGVGWAVVIKPVTIPFRVVCGVQGPLASDSTGPVGENVRALSLKVVAKNPIGHTKDDVTRVDMGVCGEPDAGRDSERPQVP